MSRYVRDDQQFRARMAHAGPRYNDTVALSAERVPVQQKEPGIIAIGFVILGIGLLSGLACRVLFYFIGLIL